MREVSVVDGAAGTALLPLCGGGLPDMLCLDRPEVVARMHRGYIAAGADIVETNSFNACSLPADTSAAVAREAVRIAAKVCREAAGDSGRRPLVAGAVGPVAGAEPERFSPAVAAIAGEGADMLVIETAYSLADTKAALEGAASGMRRAGRRLPVVVSMTLCRDSLRLWSGESLADAVQALAAFCPAALGLNCCDAAGAEAALRVLRAGWRGKIWFCPNAGLPGPDGGYPLTAEALADTAAPLIRGGLVDAVGGCCGTGPAHIAALRRLVDSIFD